MKLSKRKLKALIENYLFEIDSSNQQDIEIPFVGGDSGDSLRDGVSIEGIALKRPGDNWGYYKIVKDNYFYVKQKDFKGKRTAWKKINSKGKKKIKQSAAAGELKPVVDSSANKKQKKLKLDKFPDVGVNRGKIDEFKKKVNTGLTAFLSSYFYTLDKKYNLSDNTKKVLTGGATMITSKNISYTSKKAETILNPFAGAKNVANSVKEAHKDLLEQIARLMKTQMNDLRVEQNIIEAFFDRIGVGSKLLEMQTRKSLGSIETVGKSIKLGDAGKTYTTEKFYKNDLNNSFLSLETINK